MAAATSDLGISEQQVKGILDDTGALYSPTNWLRFNSPFFDSKIKEWEEIDAHLTGDIIKPAHIRRFLVKRAQGEDAKAFNERVKISDYTPIYSKAIISLVGMGFAPKEDARAIYEDDAGNGIGNPLDPDSDFWAVFGDTNGRGMSWDSMVFQAGVYLASMHGVWGLVEGESVSEDGRTIGGPFVRTINPRAVPRPIYRNGVLHSVRVRSVIEQSENQQNKAKALPLHTIYFADGFEKWIENENGRPQLYEPFTPYREGWTYVDRRGNPVPPVWWVPLDNVGNIGSLNATKATKLFNQESTLDFLLWVACFPKLFLDVVRQDGSFDEELFKAQKKELTDGSAILPGAGNQYAAPPMDPAKTKHEILIAKRAAFLDTFFQSVSDNGEGLKTATEVRQEAYGGIEAFLGNFVGSVDDFENHAYWFLGQALQPNEPDAWSIASIKRSQNFDPVDIGRRVDNLIGRHTSAGTIPVDSETLLDITIKSLEQEGIAVDEDRKEALREAIEKAAETDFQTKSLQSSFFGQ